MHCLLRAIHILDISDNSVWSNNGMMIKRGKLEDNRRDTSSSTTSSRQEVNPRLCNEKPEPSSPSCGHKSR
jgi:hypothetical protein